MSVLDSDLAEIDSLLKKCEKPDSKDTKSADNLKEAEDLLKTARVDVNMETDKTKKTAYQQKIKAYETRIAGLKKTALLEPERVRPVQTKAEKEDEGLAILEKSRQQLAETEEVGVGILQNLDKQKQTIQRSQDNLKTVHGKLKESDGLLNQMAKWWRG